MPHPGLPLTPASSTDLLAKESHEYHPTEKAFNLPPPAIGSKESNAHFDASTKSGFSYNAVSSTSSRKRLRNADGPKQVANTQSSHAADVSLPPPPTRPRRIIQMKPGVERKSAAGTEKAEKKKPAVGRSRSGSTTTAAGKKTARKTAHSIIERRRRSKMNEEFETLKGMIPACSGQSMHKLAILQAGIDYMRYLEQCVTDLKGPHRTGLHIPMPSQSQAPTPRPPSDIASEAPSEDEEEDDDGDKMQDVDHSFQETSPAIDSLPSRGPSRGHASSLTSPTVLPQPQQSAIWSTNTSALTSPAFGPGNDSASSLDRPGLPYFHSADASPAMLPDPMHDAAHEATTALLMLNHDRRHSHSERIRAGGGLSVRDLLSS